MLDGIAHRERPQAPAELNSTTLSLLPTGRVDEYATAVAASNVLFAATAVELAELSADDLAD